MIDPRSEMIQQQILRFATGDYSMRLPLSEKGDDTDAIITGLNTLGEELEQKRSGEDTKRINGLLNRLLKYTVLDFSEKSEVSEKGDEIDALAVGLNTLAEELQLSMEAEQAHGRELETTNEFLNMVLENIPNMVFVKDAKELRFVRFNKAGEELIGFSREDLLGKNDYDFFPAEQADFFTERDQAVIRKKKLEDIEEEPIQTKSGERWLHTKKIPILDKKGNPLYLLGISEDITERKDAQDALKRSNEQLESVNRELEAFSYSISHDLRAPLRAINGYAQIFQEDYKETMDEEGKRLLTRIQDNALKMGMLIDDLLSFSRLGRKSIEKSPIDMNELTEGVLSELSKSHVHSAVIKKGDLHPVAGDFGLLHQVMFNLVANAVKYSGKKEKPVVEIRSKEEKGEIIFSVKDNGAGFDMRYVDKLFGVFQRLHTSDDFEGTGIGLALVKRIVNKHGGRVWAEGELDSGATFYFSMPKDN